jgi:hypothetical protein
VLLDAYGKAIGSFEQAAIDLVSDDNGNLYINPENAADIVLNTAVDVVTGKLNDEITETLITGVTNIFNLF